MSQLDALRLVEEMRNRAVSLATAENYIRDPKVTSRAGSDMVWPRQGWRTCQPSLDSRCVSKQAECRLFWLRLRRKGAFQQTW